MDYEELSSMLYYKASHHKFAKKPTDFDRGYVKISDWINDLCWYYLQKRKELDKEDDLEFSALIKKQKAKILKMQPSPYRAGLLKAIDDVI